MRRWPIALLVLLLAACAPAQAETPTVPAPRTAGPADYEGWWTYTQAAYGFSILLPPDWVVDEVSQGGIAGSTPTLSLHPEAAPGEGEPAGQTIRVTFRRAGDEALLWPTGAGQGEFVAQGTLEIASQPALRMLLVCPTGEVTSIYYHQGEGQPNLRRGDLEFGFLFRAAETHCAPDQSLEGKARELGEQIIASLRVP